MKPVTPNSSPQAKKTSSPFKPVVVPHTDCIKCKHFVVNPIFNASTKHATQFGLCKRIKINYDALRESEFEYAYVAREVKCKGEYFESDKETIS
jgi:hypothetical protein